MSEFEEKLYLYYNFGVRCRNLRENCTNITILVSDDGLGGLLNFGLFRIPSI